jgi:hypothetical protein
MSACDCCCYCCRGVLQQQGYCAEGGANATTACQKFPVVIGETGSNFTKDDVKYFDNLVKFMTMTPPADKYATTKFNRWFWCVHPAWVANTCWVLLNL